MTFALFLLRVEFGIALISSPAGIAGAALGTPPSRTIAILTKALGVRHVVQALVIDLGPSPKRRSVGVGLDAMHCLTATAWAVADSDNRRVACLNALTAAGFAVAGLAIGPSSDTHGTVFANRSVPLGGVA